MSFQEHLTEDLRLVLLRVLAEAPGCRANSSILHTAVERVGHHVSRAKVELELEYLASLGAVDTDQVGPVKVVELLAVGEAHLKRQRPYLPGVKLPGLS